MRFAIRRIVDTLIAFLYCDRPSLGLSCLLASLLHSCLLTKSFTSLTHPQSFDLISETSICRALCCSLLRFAQPTCSSGIRQAAPIKPPIKRELQSAESTSAGCDSILATNAIPPSKRPVTRTSWCLCSPASLHVLSRGVLTPGPSAWPRRLLNQPARRPACLDCLA